MGSSKRREVEKGHEDKKVLGFKVGTVGSLKAASQEEDLFI